MRKFKKFLAIAIVMATVFAVMTIPASDNGFGEGYVWHSSLEINGNLVTADITVNTRVSDDVSPAVVVPTLLSASMNGTVFTEDGTEFSIEGSANDRYVNSVTASFSRDYTNTDVGQYTVIGACCTFKAMGEPAGKELQLGVQLD